MGPSPTDNKFVGMADYIVESFHDLLMGDSKMISDSNPSGGSHHPLHKCFMADTPEGHIESVHEEGATPWLALMTRSRETPWPCLAYKWSS
jgi:hypothetical protein